MDIKFPAGDVYTVVPVALSVTVKEHSLCHCPPPNQPKVKVSPVVIEIW